MKNKFQFLLFCFIVIGFSSCFIPIFPEAYESNKAQDFTEKPRKILMYFDSGTPINKRIFEDFEKNLLELIRLSNVEVVAVPYKMAALDGEGDIAQKITSVAPDVLLKISFVPPIIDGGPLVFDVKMLTPDQKKIQWRSLLSGNFTLSDRWAKNLSQKLVVQLRKDGILD